MIYVFCFGEDFSLVGNIIILLIKYRMWIVEFTGLEMFREMWECFYVREGSLNWVLKVWVWVVWIERIEIILGRDNGYVSR